MSQELIIQPSDDVASLRIWRNPTTMITEAKMAATAMMDFVGQRSYPSVSAERSRIFTSKRGHF